ncbi:hypothetical protein I3842_14G025400 [Carya illinoinensis]|uniref:Uncharacterized protein n=1 Tax=Carya illinoinensis TaxID=32201 RepID=A0A922AEF9_CARIL|nr:hypothetical protein I3842_14G025400 [Carya illinoinensis]
MPVALTGSASTQHLSRKSCSTVSDSTKLRRSWTESRLPRYFFISINMLLCDHFLKKRLCSCLHSIDELNVYIELK